MKRLTQRNIVHYLIDKGFLDTEPLMNGGFKLTTYQTRNCIFIIELDGQNDLFVKQLVNLDKSNVYFMQKDATFYHLVHQTAYFKYLAPAVPKYFGYDPKTQVLVLEYYPNSINFMEFYHEQQGQVSSQMERLAYYFTELHRDITEDIKEHTGLQFYNRLIPWVLRLNDRLKPSKSIVIQTLLEDEGLMYLVEQLKRHWNIQTLVHGDVKLANILAIRETHQLKIIDWEMAIIGDPLWDVAGLFQSFIAMHLAHLNIETNELTDDFYQMKHIQDAIQAFWDNYTTHQGWSKEEKATALDKTLRFTGARLLQTAIEMNGENATEVRPHTKRVIEKGAALLEANDLLSIVDI